MSVRNWIIAFVLGLTFLVGPQGGYAQSASENQPRQEGSPSASDDSSQSDQDGPNDLTPALNRIETAIRELIAEEDKIEAEQAESRQKRDLQAQEGMARWAEYMFYATAATVILTFAALVAIIRTLHHTRRAADYTEGMLKEAEATTKAAERTLEVTRDIGRKQVRAYIAAEPIRFGKERLPTQCTITVTNTGQSPAINVRGHLNWQWCEDINAKVPGDFDDRGDIGGMRSVASVHGEPKTMTFPAPQDRLKDAQDGKTALFFYGHFSYEDVFGETHRTRFAYRYEAEVMGDGRVRRGLIMLDQNNDAD